MTVDCPYCEKRSHLHPQARAGETFTCPFCSKQFLFDGAAAVAVAQPVIKAGEITLPPVRPPSTPRSKSFSFLKVVAGVAACVFVVSLAWVNDPGATPDTSATATSEPGDPSPVQPEEASLSDSSGDDPQPVRWLTADELYNAYDANAVATEAALKDQWVGVIGTVEEIGTDLFDFPYVTLETGHFMGVRCTFAQQRASQLFDLRKGQQVRIVGMGDGKAIDIQFKDCRLQAD